MKTALLIALIWALATPAASQDLLQAQLQRRSWDGFLRAGEDGASEAELIFVNLLTGETRSSAIRGERFALAANGLIYYDSDEGIAKLAKVEGGPRPHPFIKTAAGGQRVDWLVSADGQGVVWTVTGQLDGGGLLTSVFLADAAGSEIRELLTYGPRDGIQLAPVAFSADGGAIYMEVQTVGAPETAPYTRRSGLFALALSEAGAQTRALPVDQSCYCAVGFNAGLMLRLLPASQSHGWELEVIELATGDSRRIPAIEDINYDAAGNILVSPDGTRAAYALTRLGDAEADLHSVIVLADLEQGRQAIVSGSLPYPLKPLHFTEEGRALVFVAENGGGTWKLDLADGRLLQLAEAAYLGRLTDS